MVDFCRPSHIIIVAAWMHIKYSHRKLHTIILHAIACIMCSLSSWCLSDIRSFNGSFGSLVLATSVELVQVETEISSLKTDVIMIADRCFDLTFWLLIIIIFAIVFISNQFYMRYKFNTMLYSNLSKRTSLAKCSNSIKYVISWAWTRAQTRTRKKTSSKQLSTLKMSMHICKNTCV